MKAVLDFFNANSGSLQAVFALVVAVATVVYAWLTARLVRETRNMRRAQTEPHIEVFYRVSAVSVHFIDLVVKNIGLGPAYRVAFEIEYKTSSKALPKLASRLEGIRVLTQGLSFLAPGQEFSSFWESMLEVEEFAATRIIIRSHWHDLNGKRYTGQHVLDLGELDGLRRIGEPPLQAIKQTLEKLEHTLRSLSDSGHLRVDVRTADDRRAEEEERQRKIQERKEQLNARKES